MQGFDFKDTTSKQAINMFDNTENAVHIYEDIVKPFHKKATREVATCTGLIRKIGDISAPSMKI